MDTNKFVKVKTLNKEEVRKEVEKQKTTIRESVIKEMSTLKLKLKVKNQRSSSRVTSFLIC